ncbi:MAG: hypothetical protein PUB87_00895 [Eubacteriaceae bacterium]|nr:hypothetical protein [Eubacteriaceae bacterium]
MLVKDENARKAETWFGLNKPEKKETEVDAVIFGIPFDVVEIAPPLDPSLAAMYAGRKIVQEGWGYWADQIGKLERK